MTDENPGSGGFVPDPPVVRRPEYMTELPLLPQQVRWLTLDDRHPGANTPLVQLVHRLRGRLDLDAWRAAVGAVVDRHEGLRARFATRDGQRYQYFAPPDGLAMEYVDLNELPLADRETRARELIDQRMAIRLNYATGPLVASTVVRIADDDHAWALTIAHIVADGASLVTVIADLTAAYNNLVGGWRPDLPEVEIRYGDFLAWSANQDPNRYDDDMRYWVAQLDGVQAFDPPLDHPRPARKGAPTGEVRHGVPDELCRRAVGWGQHNRSSRYVVLLTALAMLLNRWSGQEDFCIGMPVGGSERSKPEFEHVVGLFNRMVLLRCDLSGDPTVTEVLMRTRDTVLDGLDHQDLSFGQFVEEQRIPVDPGRAQIAQVVFVINEFQDSNDLKLTGLTVAEFPLTLPGMPYDLMAFALPDKDGLSLRIFYDTGLFTEATIADVSKRFSEVLEFATTQPNARLADFTW